MEKHGSYTKTDLVFGFSINQILVAVILGQNVFWIIAKNHFEMSIKAKTKGIGHRLTQINADYGDCETKQAPSIIKARVMQSRGDLTLFFPYR